MKTESNENAFPVNQGQDFAVREWGLTKREYFAALAMQGCLLTGNTNETFTDIATAVKISVQMADALIEELNK